MFRQDLVLQGKYQSTIYNPAEAAIVRIYYPPDRDGTWPVPRGGFCQAFHTSLHFTLCSPMSSTGQETWRPERWGVSPKYIQLVRFGCKSITLASQWPLHLSSYPVPSSGYWTPARRDEQDPTHILLNPDFWLLSQTRVSDHNHLPWRGLTVPHSDPDIVLENVPFCLSCHPASSWCCSGHQALPPTSRPGPGWSGLEQPTPYRPSKSSLLLWVFTEPYE